MLVNKPYFFRPPETVNGDSLLVGDIIDIGTADNPELALVVSPTFFGEEGDGEYKNRRLGMRYLPLQLVSYDDKSPRSDRQWIMPRQTVMGYTGLNASNQIRVLLHLRPHAFNVAPRDFEKLEVQRIGSLGSSEFAEKLFRHAFDRLGPEVLLASPDRSAGAILRGRTRSADHIAARNMADSLDSALGNNVFDPEELRIHAFDKKQAETKPKKAAFSLPKTIYSIGISKPKNPAQESALTELETNPDHIPSLINAKRFHSPNFWKKLSDLLEIENIHDVLIIDDENLERLRGSFTNADTPVGPKTYMEFLRCLSNLDHERYGFKTQDIDKFFGLALTTEEIEQFKNDHNEAYEFAYKLTQLAHENSLPLEGIIHALREKGEGDVRSKTAMAVLVAGYQYRVDQKLIEPIPEPQAASQKPAIFDITLADAITINLFKPEDDEVTQFEAFLGKPVEGAGAPITLREAWKMVSKDPESLSKKFEDVGPGISKRLAAKIERVFTNFEEYVELIKEQHGDMVFESIDPELT